MVGRSVQISGGLAVRSVAAAAMLALAGCSTLIGAGGPPPAIFDLAAPATFAAGGSTSAQLLVPPPSAVAALASNRIAVRPDPAQIAYYPAAVWSDELPAMLQLALVRAFENSGRVRAVGKPGDSLAIDYQVLVDVRAFEIDVAGTDSARVVLGVKLLDDRTGRVRATRLVEATVPAGGTSSAEDAVAALDAAAGAAVSELVVWTAETL